MRTISLFIGMMVLSIFSPAQIITLKFTAVFNNAHVNIDSVRVTNLTHPGDTVLYWPDTTLNMGTVGIPLNNNRNRSSFNLQLCSANPVTERAVFQIFIPVNGIVNIRISDVTGKTGLETAKYFPSGRYLFHYSPTHPGVSIISAFSDSEVRSVKIIKIGSGDGNKDMSSHIPTLDFIRVNETTLLPKSGRTCQEMFTQSFVSTQTFVYTIGDSLRLTGWYNGSNTVLKIAPSINTTYIFSFGINYPCPGQSSFIYGGQTYNTVQIGGQCWMKENLNIGTMVTSTNTPSIHSDCNNNGIIEKYCYNNDLAQCAIYGGLYDWEEMMQYSSIPGTQGICPTGWHLPTDAEYCTMTTYLDPSINCGVFSYSGTNAGGKLKEMGTTHWQTPNTGATNESGFTTFGAGFRGINGYFGGLTYYTYFWSSSDDATTSAIEHGLEYNYADIGRSLSGKTSGNSVRCVRNY